MELILSIVIALMIFGSIRAGTFGEQTISFVRGVSKLLVGLVAVGVALVVGFYTYVNWTDWTNPVCREKVAAHRDIVTDAEYEKLITKVQAGCSS
jgi:hypothetical protein